MKRVGVRELRSGLSRFLKLVRAGEMIEVTDRGEPIAKIIPVGVPEHLAKLMAEGRVSWSGKPFEAPQKPVRLAPGSAPMSDAIAEDRP
jgi:prevent-host-death family protein